MPTIAYSGDQASNSDLRLSYDLYLNSDTFVWADGMFSTYEQENADATIDGNYAVLHFGVDRWLGASTVVGLMASVDHMSESGGIVLDAEGTGWMIGPYFSTALDEDLFMSGRLLYGQSSNDAEILTDGRRMKGDFDSERLLAVLTLTGRTEYGSFNILPEVSLAYARETQRDYLVSDGTFTISVPGQDLDYGQFSIATEIQYPYGTFGEDGFLFLRPVLRSAILADEIYGANSSDLMAAIEVGYHSTPSDALWHGVSISYDGIGESGFQAVSLRGYLEYRF